MSDYPRVTYTLTLQLASIHSINHLQTPLPCFEAQVSDRHSMPNFEHLVYLTEDCCKHSERLSRSGLVLCSCSASDSVSTFGSISNVSGESCFSTSGFVSKILFIKDYISANKHL